MHVTRRSRFRVVRLSVLKQQHHFARLWLEHSSHQAVVNFYRCASGHVWTVPKNDPTGPFWFVTEVPPRPTAP